MTNKRLEVSLKLRSWLFPGLVAVTFILSLIFPFKGWWIIILSLGLSLLFSFWSMHSIKNNFDITREMRFGWARVGDVLEDRIIVNNQGMLPTMWLEIMDQTTIPGNKNTIATSLSPSMKFTWKKKHMCTRRGVYRIGPTSVHTSDIFGFYKLSFHDPSETNILITPPTIPLPQIEVASGGQTGDGRMVSGLVEQSVAVSTIRDYQPQDPLHYIHWPTTAKRNELSSRVFENTPTGNWWIIQDMYGPTQYGMENRNTVEAGIILSASLTEKGLRRGKAVGLISNDRAHTWITAQHAGDQSVKILQALALFEVGSLPLKELLKKSIGAFRQTASLIIITSDISMDWWEPVIWLKAKGMIPTLLLFDPTSFGTEVNIQPVFAKLRNSAIHTYKLDANLFSEKLNVKENPLWEWRVFGTGKAIPVKKPKDQTWKRLR